MQRFIGAVLLSTGLSWWGLAGESSAAGPATTIKVALTPSSIVANGTARSTASATVTDATGAGVRNQKVTISSSDQSEAISAVKDHGNGTYTAVITSSTTSGQATITATDASVTPNLTSAPAILTQTPDPARAITAPVLRPTSIPANGISTSTVTAKVTTARGGPVPRQLVTFSSSDPGEAIGPVTDQGGTYSAQIRSSTALGSATITVTDASVTPNLKQTATLTQVPVRVTLALQPASIVANGTATSTVIATATDANGNRVTTDNVAFSSSDPGETVGPVANNHDGTYSAQIKSSYAVGFATITATDESAVTSPRATATATLTQTATGTTTSLLAVPSAAVTNQPVTLFAVVTATSGSPSGTITFKNRGASIGGCVAERITPSNPAAACTTSFAASTSPEQLTAAFTPSADSTAGGSASAVANVTVAQDATSTSLDASNTVNLRARTTYTVTVAPPASRPGPLEPSGLVEFFDRGQPIASCLSQPLTGGGATCTVTYKSVGTHSITARYGGDANFASSSSSARAVNAVPVPVHVFGIITSTMQWSFYHTPSYTKVIALVVNGASPGATVLIKCHGRGCPFVKRANAVRRTRRCGPKGKRRCSTHGRIDLTPVLRNHRLHVGARINIEIVRPGWIGKYYMFTVRSGRGPRIQTSCLAPGGTRPGVGC
jgi:Bacterial Ig-like domain (group 3)/Invasin, domain 3